MIGVTLIAIVVVAAIMLAMAAGQLVNRKCLRGSCGGLSAGSGADGDVSCDACPMRQPRPPAAPRTDRRP